jgi:hypothetical protein
LEGLITTTQIPITQEITVPITTQAPGAWIVEVDSPTLGRKEVTLTNNLPAGRVVYLEYQLGRLSGEAEVVEVRVEPLELCQRPLSLDPTEPPLDDVAQSQ